MYNYVICSFRQWLRSAIKKYICRPRHFHFLNISTLSFLFVFVIVCLSTNNTRAVSLYSSEEYEKKMSEWIWKIGLRHFVRARTILSRQKRHIKSEREKKTDLLFLLSLSLLPLLVFFSDYTFLSSSFGIK